MAERQIGGWILRRARLVAGAARLLGLRERLAKLGIARHRRRDHRGEPVHPGRLAGKPQDRIGGGIDVERIAAGRGQAARRGGGRFT